MAERINNRRPTRRRTGPKTKTASAPSPKPDQLTSDIAALARRHTEAALGAFVAVMQDGGAPAAARVSAATQILTWGYGKSVGAGEGTGDEPKMVRLTWEE